MQRPSDKSLFLHKAPSVKSTPASPQLFHHENNAEKYQFSSYNGGIYWLLCVLLFQFSVSWSSEMQFDAVPQNMGWHTILCCILVTWISFLFVVCFLLGNSPVFEFYVPKFRNTICSISIGRWVFFIPTCLWRWNSVPKHWHIKFRRGELPSRKRTTFRTWQKFEIKNHFYLFLAEHT